MPLYLRRYRVHYPDDRRADDDHYVVLSGSLTVGSVKQLGAAAERRAVAMAVDGVTGHASYGHAQLAGRREAEHRHGVPGMVRMGGAWRIRRRLAGTAGAAAGGAELFGQMAAARL